MEILAPAGDEQSFYAAINNGADAVYLGLGDFNARAKSTFFNADNIAQFVKIAHLYGVKVHITVNTLVRDDEFEALSRTLDACVAAKADAYIVQDLGVLDFIKRNYPGAVLHASTQMGIHNLDGARAVEKLGVKRVVLSRETKMQDIAEIKQNTGLEVEYFVQGALCVAFSGNCYMSSILSGESGNRGKCLQPCRMFYTATIRDEALARGYLLSARDLCLIKSLGELYKLGVDSLKIEGRLRRAGYVAQAVNSYRKAVDAVKSGIKINEEKEIEALRQVFSRGEFNERAYLDKGTPNKVINTRIQNHLGLKIGKVLKCERFKNIFKITLRTNKAITAGDGLKFLDAQGEQAASLGVGNVESLGKDIYVIYSKHKLLPDLEVYKILDSKRENALLQNERKITLCAHITALADKPLSVRVWNDEIDFEHVSEHVCERAKTAPTDANEMIAQFGKTGDTVFVVEQAHADTDGVFVPKSILNKLRRDALESAGARLIQVHEQYINAQIKSTKVSVAEAKHPRECVRGNIYVAERVDELDGVKINSYDYVCIAPEVYTVEKVREKVEEFNGLKCNFALQLPVIANGEDIQILDAVVAALPEHFALAVNNLYGVKYVSRIKIAGPELNITNMRAANVLEGLGISKFVFSKELPRPDPSFYSSNAGRVALMHFCHCPYKTVFNKPCDACAFRPGLKIAKSSEEEFEIGRTVISQCYFTMYLRRPQEITDDCWADLRK